MSLIENQIKKREFNLFGLDEVGRGPLAGPVVSCCCSFSGKKSDLIKAIELNKTLGICDSKKLSGTKRQKILTALSIDVAKIRFARVYQFNVGSITLSFCLSKIEHHEIDKINILQASLKSMDHAFLKVNKKYQSGSNEIIWVDGNKLPAKIKSRGSGLAIVKGDSRSFLIALASIIAKEKRDLMMQEYALTYPGYGFEKHAGYPTKAHKEALLKLGPCSIHRLSFKGVKK